MVENFEASKNSSYTVPNWSQLEDNAVDIKTALYRCQDEDPHPSSDRACLSTATKEWDNQLNNVYQSLLSDLNPKAAGSLVDSERQWIQFQQKEEKAINGILNRPNSNVAYERARMQLHETRAEELRVSASDYDTPSLGEATDACLAQARNSKSTNICYQKRLEQADGIMKGTYEQLLGILTPQEKSLLRASQEQWRHFQAKEYRYIENLHPQIGSSMNLSSVAAKLQISEGRNSQLEFFLKSYQRAN